MSSNKHKRIRPGFSRRGFLKGATLGAAAVSGANLLSSKADATGKDYYPAKISDDEFDFTEQSGRCSQMR